jgi:hypothetical protein
MEGGRKLYEGPKDQLLSVTSLRKLVGESVAAVHYGYHTAKVGVSSMLCV